MTDDERAALVERALRAHMDYFAADYASDEARDAMRLVVAVIEGRIRADERERCIRLVYGHAGSDNDATRIVDAIRAQGGTA